MLKWLRRLWRKKKKAAPMPADFDPDFYRGFYPDLYRLNTPSQLWLHYERHGRVEGRLRSLDEMLAGLEKQHGTLPASFSVQAYRLLNEDLARSLSHDYQFTRHFLEHGRREKRPYRVTQLADTPGLWPALFRSAEFVAMAQAWLPNLDLDRAQALRLFVDQGIDRLAPISFRHGFDPAFYRAVYTPFPGEDDVTLYRDWLSRAEERAPNEDILLDPYLGGGNFPSFDWQAYGASLEGAARIHFGHRAQALIHYFEQGFPNTEAPAPGADGELLALVGDFHLRQQRLRLAARAYDLATGMLQGKATASFLYRRGLARQARSDTEALGDIVASARHENGQWEAVETATKLLAAWGDFGQAVELLRQRREVWRSRSEFLPLVHELMQAWYERARSEALIRYADGGRDEADISLTATLEAIWHHLSSFEELPVPLPARADGSVVMLANQELPQCKHYRVEQKLRQFAFAKIPARAFGEEEADAFINALIGAKAAIFYRVPASPAVMRAMLHAQALGIPTYYEIDDLVFDARYYPDSYASYAGQIDEAGYRGLELGVPLYRFALSRCDVAIASTTALAEAMNPLVRQNRALVLRNGLDQRNEPAIERERPLGGSGESVTLFYGTGTKAHSGDFARDLAPAILELLASRPHLRLVVVGYLDLGQAFGPHRDRVHQQRFVPDLDDYWAMLGACDINLAVLPPGPMADSKSEIKWLEAAMLAIPSVLSASATYREVLSDGVDAVLIERPEQWHDKLAHLIDDAAARKAIGVSARVKALRHYDMAVGAKALSEEFGVPAAAKMRRQTRKVLICNVLFSPQSFGGGTRVVEDNVNYLIEHCPDVEVSIFTSNPGSGSTGELQVDSYRGRPVFRAVPLKGERSDWKPFDATMGQCFAQVLARVQPDLVHFHCIQRLTASIVQETLEAGIPYVVTLHDGWWISDSQFFIDRDERVKLPGPDPFVFCAADGVDLPKSLARRQSLARLLARARRIVSVSESFAQVYRHAGVKPDVTIENGVTLLQPRPRRPRPDGRLALGHLGGRSAYKGALLLEAALRQGHYDRLALTMIDNRRGPEDTLATTWGATPVLIRGASPQAAIADLYAELDVVLAPSLWPESYGLVAREALALGLNIVVSNRGALAEAVPAEGPSAVIDVATVQPLADLLLAMNNDPDRWRAPARATGPAIRSAADQGRDLAALYREIIPSGRV